MFLLQFHVDEINDSDEMYAPTYFRVSVVGTQGLVLLCLVLSAVDGVGDSIVGSSKFKGVHGLYFST